MARPLKFTQDQVTTALTENRGMVAVAARRLHCSPNTVRTYVTRYPAIAEAIAEERQVMGDIAELALFKAIENGEVSAITFYLRTQCRDRGYIERTDVRTSGMVTIDIDTTAVDAALEYAATRRSLRVVS